MEWMRISWVGGSIYIKSSHIHRTTTRWQLLCHLVINSIQPPLLCARSIGIGYQYNFLSWGRFPGVMGFSETLLLRELDPPPFTTFLLVAYNHDKMWTRHMKIKCMHKIILLVITCNRRIDKVRAFLQNCLAGPIFLKKLFMPQIVLLVITCNRPNRQGTCNICPPSNAYIKYTRSTYLLSFIR